MPEIPREPRSPIVRHSAVIASLFPLGVETAELRGDPDPTGLHASERRVAATFAPKRLREFAAGRTCARHALAAFGYGDVALTIDDDRRPRWPAGIVGSISHTTGFCGAVVADERRHRSIGFDVERTTRVDRDLWKQIFTRSERGDLGARDAASAQMVAAVIFSAKEAFYKFQFGITRAWIDFHDVSIVVARDVGDAGFFTIETRQTHATMRDRPTGRYAIAHPYVFTGVASNDVSTDFDARRTPILGPKTWL